MRYLLYLFIIQICSGIIRGKVLNGDLYAQRLLMLIYLHLFTSCFMKISLFHKIVCKQMQINQLQ